MTKAINKPRGIEMRPHHAEGAMRIISRALGTWDYVKDGANEDPMTVMEMYFDAATHLRSTTSPKTKKDIEAKWQDNPNYQKLYKLLAAQYEKLLNQAKSNTEIDPDRDLINQGLAEMYQELKQAYEEDTEASVAFINGYDFVCNKCIEENGGTPPCLLMKLIQSKEDPQMIIDDEVRKAHEWEYGKPYKIRDVLNTFLTEGTRRKMFLIFEDQGNDQEFLNKWRDDVAQSKKPQ